MRVAMGLALNRDRPRDAISSDEVLSTFDFMSSNADPVQLVARSQLSSCYPTTVPTTSTASLWR